MYEARQAGLKNNPQKLRELNAKDSPPLLLPGAGPAWDAYHILSADRPAALDGPSAIPFSAICLYADRYGVGPEWFDDLRILIAALDAEYLDHLRKKKPVK